MSGSREVFDRASSVPFLRAKGTGAKPVLSLWTLFSSLACWIDRSNLMIVLNRYNRTSRQCWSKSGLSGLKSNESNELGSHLSWMVGFPTESALFTGFSRKVRRSRTARYCRKTLNIKIYNIDKLYGS